MSKLPADVLQEIEQHIEGIFSGRLKRSLVADVVKELSRDVLDNLTWRFGNLENQVANLHARLQALEAKSK
jgi:hypothetical protein